MKSLLELRNVIKKKKPVFSRQDNHKKPKLGNKWRKPKGLQSKMRLHLRGYKRSPEVGWGSPKEVKGLTKDGYNPVYIMSLSDLSSLDPAKDAAIIGSRIGKRKKKDIIKSLIDKKIKIVNIKDPAQYLKIIESSIQERKQEKQTRAKEKAIKEKAKEEKAKEEEAKEEEKKAAETSQDQKQSEEKTSSESKTEDLSDKLDSEDKKKEEKKEKDKILTKKE